MANSDDDKPIVLKAIELILANPQDIHNEANDCLQNFKNPIEINQKVK